MISNVALLGFLLLLASGAPLTSQAPPPGSPIPAPCLAGSDAASLEELARRCPQLSTFSQLLSQADDYGRWLLDCGRKCGKLGQLARTLFVPVDEAWAEYFASTGTSLEQLTSKAGRRALTTLMRYHVLPRVLSSAEVPAVAAEGAAGGGERLVTLQGGSLLLTRRASTNAIRVIGRRNAALVVQPDIPIGRPVVHLVSSVLLLPDPASTPQPQPPSPPAPPYPRPPPQPGRPSLQPPDPYLYSGDTVFNLTWGRPVDMDLIVVSELASGGSVTMFYSYQGPEKLIGGGAMSAFGGEVGPLSGFYSQSDRAWEALRWPWPRRPAQGVYTICSFFYNLDWAAGTVIGAASPLWPQLAVTTDGGARLVGRASRNLTLAGQFSFTLLPRMCTPDCAWYLAQVCVDEQRRIQLVAAPDRC